MTVDEFLHEHARDLIVDTIDNIWVVDDYCRMLKQSAPNLLGHECLLIDGNAYIRIGWEKPLERLGRLRPFPVDETVNVEIGR